MGVRHLELASAAAVDVDRSASQTLSCVFRKVRIQKARVHVVQSEAKTSQDSDPEVEESVSQPVVDGEMLKVATRGQRDVMTRGCPEVAEKLRAPLPPPVGGPAGRRRH